MNTHVSIYPGVSRRAAIYARCAIFCDWPSSPDNEIKAQIRSATSYIIENGLTFDESLLFVDDGMSGNDYEHRPGLKLLRDHYDDIDFVVVSSPSRIGRSHICLLHEIENMREHNVELICLDFISRQ